MATMALVDFTPSDFCQIQFERFHPDKISETFWRNALFAGKTDMAFFVVYSSCEKEAIPIYQANRIRKPE